MTLLEAKQCIHAAEHIAVLTGAGISAASGIATFRDNDGLWRNFRAEELATPQAYASDPALVWEWYLWRLTSIWQAEANSAHYALVSLAQDRNLTLVTQNVDGLHTRAGSKDVLELHGNITRSRCEACEHRDIIAQDVQGIPHCLQCGHRSRPDVVWFGEMLSSTILEQAIVAFQTCDVALIIGTSSMVQPAASLAQRAQSAGAAIIEINPNRTPLSDSADYFLQSDAVTAMQQLNDHNE